MRRRIAEDRGNRVTWSSERRADDAGRDEPLFELETDKASNEVPSPGDGVLHVRVQEGETVQIGQAVAMLAADAAGFRRRFPARSTCVTAAACVR